MQNQPISHHFKLAQVENIVQKILVELKSVQGFKYSQLLRENTRRFAQDFQKKNAQFIQTYQKQPFNLQLLFKTDPVKEVELTKQQSGSKTIKAAILPPNIFLYSFELPCGYKKYVQMIKNPHIQTKLDDIINSYELKDEIHKSESMNVEVVELSYKRVLIISPREFVYVRVFFKENKQNQTQNNKCYWMLTFSIPYEKKTDKTTAQIILTVQKIEQCPKEGKIRVKVYSEIDMKTAAKPDITRNKGFAQIKKYVQRLYDYSKTMKQPQE